MKHKLLISILFILFTGTLVGQDEKSEPKDKPVRAPWESPYLLDNQTTLVLPERTLQMAIQHKFGTLDNGASDIWGIYSSANIRLGFDYVVYKNIQVGYGLTRTDMVHDFNAKWTIFEQTRKNTKPVALTLFGNIGIDGRGKDALGVHDEFTNRLSYFGQVLISRKLGYRATLQAGVSFSHFNMVDTSKTDFDFDRVGLHLAGRVRATSTGCVVFNYDQPLNLLRLQRNENVDLHPNITVGYEISTSTHAFHIYMGYTNQIIPQYIMMREDKDFEFNQFNIGFTITRLWGL